MDTDGKLKAFLNKYKYPVIVLTVGILLMTLPMGGGSKDGGAEEQFRRILCSTEGVGRAEVLVSEKGVVIVCDGADSASVRLDILRCVESYTGFGSGNVTILKMKD